LLDAAETVLGYFRFDGSVYRKSDNREIGSSKQKKWWDELREERRKDIEVIPSSTRTQEIYSNIVKSAAEEILWI
jgi:hypothetical protein